MSFFDNGYEVVENAISKEHAKCCALEFQIFCDYLHHVNRGFQQENIGDGQVNKAFYWYSPFFGEALLVLLKPKIENIIKKRLSPCYSYGRIYFPGSVMNSHKDRPSCEFSATLTLDVDGEAWPIYFKNLSGKKNKLVINPGSMVVYQGTKLEHWRDEMKNSTKSQTQIFLHYVDSDGLYKDHIYDKRPFLGFPADSKF